MYTSTLTFTMQGFANRMYLFPLSVSGQDKRCRVRSCRTNFQLFAVRSEPWVAILVVDIVFLVDLKQPAQYTSKIFFTLRCSPTVPSWKLLPSCWWRSTVVSLTPCRLQFPGLASYGSIEKSANLSFVNGPCLPKTFSDEAIKPSRIQE